MTPSAKQFKYNILIPAMAWAVEAVLGKRKSGQKQMYGNSPFFILGSGRTGSTLLASILNRHGSIFLPPEQYALPFVVMKWRILRHYPWEDMAKIVVNDITATGNNQFWDVDKEWKQNLTRKLIDLEPEYRSLRNIVDLLFHTYGGQNEANDKLWGDHSPVSTEFFDHIDWLYPESKKIFMIRDPRDVVVSYQKLKGNPASNMKNAAEKWIRSIEVIDRHPEWNSNNSIHLVRYEDLASDPETNTRKTLEFLQLPFDPSILQPNTGSSLGTDGLQHHKNLEKPISASAIGKWKTQLDSKDLQAIEPIIRHRMAEFGYSW